MKNGDYRFRAPQLCDGSGRRVPSKEIIILTFNNGIIAFSEDGRRLWWKVKDDKGDSFLKSILRMEGMELASPQQWRTAVQLFAAGAGRDLAEVDISANGYTNYALLPRSRHTRQVMTMAGDLVTSRGPTIVSTAELQRIGEGSARVAAMEHKKLADGHSVQVGADGSVMSDAYRAAMSQDEGELVAAISAEADDA